MVLLRQPAVLLVCVAMLGLVAALDGRRSQASLQKRFFDGANDPEIAYATRPVTDRVSTLNRRIETGEARLAFEPGRGYLRSLLEALEIPVESQLAVFSKTSLQAPLISPQNPRALFFNDAVVVAWPGGGFIEVAAHDARQGVIFYTLEQREVEQPRMKQSTACLTCHDSYATLSVPGMLVRSIATSATGKTVPRLGNYTSDLRSPFAERWGGWYVTGDTGSMVHMGNTTVADVNMSELSPSHRPSLPSLRPLFDTDRYPSPYSDIVALLVFDHQMFMTNLLTRVGWEIRVATASGSADLSDLVDGSARELVDGLLFVDETPLPSPVRGTSGFTERFAARGPADDLGRSLRQFDLRTRLMRYPCSYMIYSDAFDALPPIVKGAVYARLWEVLSGRETGGRYARLSRADRQAILRILLQTRADLPAIFRGTP